MANLNSLGGIHYEMIKRCYNSKSVMWKRYGAKGIKVCQEWHDIKKFKEWAEENGYEKGLRLERKDSEKDYCPENCYFGETLKAKQKREMSVKKRAKINKAKKEAVGIKNFGDSRLFSVLNNMIERCYNPNHKSYKYYGGRGIKICDEWIASGYDGKLNFYKWAINNGWKELDDPTIQTIDRIDPNGNYSPENCRFITLQEQQQNRRNVKIYNYYGENLTLRQIAIKEKVDYRKLIKMVNKDGINIYDSLNDLKK